MGIISAVISESLCSWCILRLQRLDGAPFHSAPASGPPPPPVVCGPVPLAFVHAMLEFLIQLVISVPPHALCTSPSTGALRLASISMSESSWAVNCDVAKRHRSQPVPALPGLTRGAVSPHSRHC